MESDPRAGHLGGRDFRDRNPSLPVASLVPAAAPRGGSGLPHGYGSQLGTFSRSLSAHSLGVPIRGVVADCPESVDAAVAETLVDSLGTDVDRRGI